MDSKEVRKMLSSLTDREREVLGYFCQEMRYVDIGSEIGLAEGTVKIYMSRIFHKLGIGEYSKSERRQILLEKFCPALKNEILDIPPPDPEVLEPISEEVEQLLDELQYPLVVADTQKLVPPSGERRRPRSCRTLVLGILLGMILVAVVVVGILGGSDLFTNGEAEETIPVDTLIAQALAATSEHQTTEPTQGAGFEEQPTLTPESTITPSPPSLFEDDFDHGLSTRWQIVSGNPIVVNGELTADQDTWLMVGDPSWTNYQVDFDGDAADCWFSWSSNFVAVMVENFDNMIAYKWADCESFWYVVKGGGWQEVPNSEFKPGYETPLLRFTIIAQNGEFAVYINGIKQTSFFNADFQSGRVGLMIAADTRIDNFKVVPLD